MKNTHKEYFCADVFKGIEEIFIEEMKKVFGGIVEIQKVLPGFVYFYSKFDLEKLYKLKTAKSIQLIVNTEGKVDSEINAKKIISGINLIRSTNRLYFGKEVFKTLKVTAKDAGRVEFINLKRKIQNYTRLQLVFKSGDLVVSRVDGMWNEIKIRVTSRPLSAREWRICNFKAALDATLASAMIYLTNPTKDDRVLNVCSGSGSLLIERCLVQPYPQTAIGIEISESPLECAKKNAKAANIFKKYKFLNGDATDLLSTVADEKFNVILGDLPFGMSVGSTETNRELYEQILENISYVAENKARICLITKDVENMNAALEKYSDKFKLKEKIRTRISTNIGVYINPVVYLFEFSDKFKD